MQIPVRCAWALNGLDGVVSVAPCPHSQSSAILRRTNLSRPAGLERGIICINLTLTSGNR
jgi:hypothetical protein